jgi:hypothetical protein
MKAFLNEQSFPERSNQPDEIFSILYKLTQIAGIVKKIANNQNIRRSRDLKNREVLVGKTLGQFIIELDKHSDPNRRKVKQLFLEIFSKAPFLSGAHAEDQEILDEKGKCLKFSCFDDASACRTGAAVISVEAPQSSTSPYVLIDSSVFGRRKILNIDCIQQAEQLLWVYKNNDKHDIPKDFLVNGEVHSAMHLSEVDAQQVLTNGVKIGRCIFNRVGEQWYKFHCHEKNVYHGFPIAIKTPYKEFSAARILFEEITSNEDGQLFEDLLDIRVKD